MNGERRKTRHASSGSAGKGTMLLVFSVPMLLAAAAILRLAAGAEAAVPASKPASAPASQPAGQPGPGKSVSPNPKERAHAGAVLTLAIDSKGEMLASCGEDGYVKLWSLPKLQLVTSIRAHEGPVSAVGFVPTRGQLVSVGRTDKTLKFWSLPDGGPKGSLTHPDYDFGWAAVSPNGKLIAWAPRQRASNPWVLTLPDGRIVAKGEIRTDGNPNCITWLVGESVLGTTGLNRLTLWFLDANKTAIPFRCGEPLAMALMRDGKVLVTASWASDEERGTPCIRFWSFQTGALVKSISTEDDRDVSTLHCSPDGKLLIAAGKIIKVFAFPSCEDPVKVEAHGNNGVRTAAITPDSKFLVTGGRDGTIIVWSLPGCQAKAVLSDPAVK